MFQLLFDAPVDARDNGGSDLYHSSPVSVDARDNGGTDLSHSDGGSDLSHSDGGSDLHHSSPVSVDAVDGRDRYEGTDGSELVFEPFGAGRFHLGPDPGPPGAQAGKLVLNHSAILVIASSFCNAADPMFKSFGLSN